VTERLYVGAITGTSVDGLDLALLEAREPPAILAGRTVPIPPALVRQLKGLGSGELTGLDEFGEADHRLGALIAHAIVEFLADLSLPPDRIAAIGSHGQTVRHRPHGATPFSLQIGDPNLIAEITGIDTVADFRRRDIAAGGQGAPLVPPFHEALFRTSAEDRTVLNIGGIANISYLPSDATAQIGGFDTGPGNALIDAWAEHHIGTAYDDDGAWARSGNLDHELLSRLLADPYFESTPPKSTGKELFNLTWLKACDPELALRQSADVQATLAELTALTVQEAIRRWAPTTRTVIVCGGGRLNGYLMERLGACLTNTSVEPTESFSYNGDWIEAAAFAWLAHRTLNGRTGSDRAVTGARSSRVLGAYYPKAVR
jgi:anhydro-N-acetylmuramic acid kinase